MNQRKCRRVGNSILYCSELQQEIHLKLRFKKIPSGNILSIPDDKIINFCPFCGVSIRI